MFNKKSALFCLSIFLTGSFLHAKLFEQSAGKVKMIDALLTVTPKGYGQIVGGVKLGGAVYTAINDAKRIYASDADALQIIIDENSNNSAEMIVVLRDRAAAIKSDGKNAGKEVSLPEEVDKALTSILLDYMLIENKTFFKNIYKDGVRGYLKPCFRESLEGRLGEAGVSNSVLFCSLDKNCSEVEDFYREKMATVTALYATVFQLLLFLSDLLGNLPNAKKAYIKYLKSEYNNASAVGVDEK